MLIKWLLSMFIMTDGACTTMQEEPTPTFLYKILPMNYWQETLLKNHVVLTSDDRAFIHFSKEDQLERICTKYWADAPEYVILKIHTEKLHGNLVLEINPGGMAKYYHLYNGSIPMESIIEARIIYQKKAPSSPLEIVKIGHPVLRTPTRQLSREEILSPTIQQLIEDMITTIRQAPGVGLAAPQVGYALQLLVIEDIYTSRLTEEERQIRDRNPIPLHVVINPTLEVIDQEDALFFEGCLSGPDCLAITPRSKAVKVRCLNEKAEPVVIEAKGWYARILQHEIDHLQGTLFLDRADITTVTNAENYQNFWKDTSSTQQLPSK